MNRLEVIETSILSSPNFTFPPILMFNNLQGVHISPAPLRGFYLRANLKLSSTWNVFAALNHLSNQLNTDFDEVFAYKTVDFTESGLYVPEDGNIDLGPVVREYLMLEYPIKPLCKPDCQGLCTVCGENLNYDDL